MEDAVSSDRSAEVERLYREYGAVVYRRCLRLLRDREAARDATQEVFVKLLRDMSKLAGRETALPWIYRVATNHCLNVRRGARRGGARAGARGGGGLSRAAARGEGALPVRQRDAGGRGRGPRGRHGARGARRRARHLPADREPQARALRRAREEVPRPERAMTRCPSDLELEAHLLDPERSRAAAHVATCARCQARLEEMRRVGDEFRREVYPATVDAVVERSRARRPSRRWLVALAPVAAAAAAAAFLFLGPSDDYVGVKGGELALAVFVAGPEGARGVADGAPVPANAALRFQVRPARACRLWLLSVDASGQVSRLYPAAGDEAAEVAAPGGPLPGGAILDGRPGPERIFAVCTERTLPFSAVERSAQAAGRGDSAVRASRGLSGLPR